MQQTDEELVLEIKQGSRSAMEVLIRRYYKFVFAVTYRKTGDYHIACDLTQEVFMKVAKSIFRYEGKGKFKGWLTAITYHHCTDFYRSHRNTQRQNEDQMTLVTLDDSTQIYRLLERNDERMMIKNALMQLPDYQRDTIVLNYFEGMKNKEIAEVMQCSESTVKSRLHQGLKKLRKLIKGDDVYDEKRNLS